MRDPVRFGWLSGMMPRLQAEEALLTLALQNPGDLRELSNVLTATTQGLTEKQYQEAKGRAMKVAAEAQAALEILKRKKK